MRISTLELTLHEPSAPSIATAKSATGAPIRLLPVKVWFPTAIPSGALLAGRPWPLLVFSQGFDESVNAYTGLMNAWVHAGYVVAAPTYPLTDPSSKEGVNENDIVNHPGDLRYVIFALKQISANSNSPLHGVVDPTRIAVIGQSDGGDVSLAVANNSCCRDASVQAAIILSGAELASFGGSYYSGGSVPLLVAQGSQDTINPPQCSVQLYNQAPQPKYYLSIAGAAHLPPYVSPGPLRAGVARVTIAFLNAYLKHRPSALAALGSPGTLPPQESLTSASTVPAPTGATCPGSP
ncbi:MAG TPA: hypothetical protein VFP55_10635 [Solirubrobacteraceae bacterium]|nr:hypothetical protein [Solirubrobacteraceae bacterium]